jgi:branched-chain amino acid transport system substrate-binding protein
MRIRRHGRSAALALAAVAALALTACSGGVGGGGSATSSAAGGGDESATSGTVKIGMAAPFSGAQNMYGDYMKNGAQLAVDKLNADGGVLGQQVELVTADDACDPTQAASAAQKLVTDGVVASVGGYCSGSTLPTLPIFYDNSIPMVIPVANSDNLPAQGLPNVFLLDGTGTQQAASALKWVQKQGYTNLVAIDDKTDYSANLAASFKKQAEEAGLAVTALALTPGEKDFSAQVNDIKSAGADFFYFTGYSQEAGLLVKQAVEGGYEGGILLGDGSVDALVAEVAGAENAKNVYATFTMTPDMLDDGGAFQDLYSTTFGSDPGPYTIHSYDAVMVWAEAAEDAGEFGMEAIDAALAKLSTSGLTGPISFNEDGTRSGGGGFVIVKVSDDGTFKLADALES